MIKTKYLFFAQLFLIFNKIYGFYTSIVVPM